MASIDFVVNADYRKVVEAQRKVEAFANYVNGLNLNAGVNIDTQRLTSDIKSIKSELSRLSSDMANSFMQAANNLNQVTQSAGKANASIGGIRGGINDATAALAGMTGQTRSLNSALSSTGGTISEISSSVGSFLKQFTAGAIAYQTLSQSMQMFKSAIGTIQSYSAANSTLGAILGLDANQLDTFTESSERLGRSTVFTASQVTALQTALSKLGFGGDQIHAMEEQVLGFAQATGASLDDAASTAGAVLRMFGKEAKETGNVVGALSAATMRSALDFRAIADNIAQFGPVAHSIGFSLEDSLTLFGELKNAGIDGSVAATSLRNILNELAGGKLQKQLGYQVTNLEGFVQAMNDLQAQGFKGAEGVKKSMDSIGKRGGAQFLALINASDHLLELNQQIKAGANEETTSGMASRMTNNLAGSLKMMQSAWEGFILTFRNADGIMKDTVDRITEAIGWVRECIAGDGDLSRSKIEGIIDSVELLIGALATVKGGMYLKGLADSLSVVHQNAVDAVDAVVKASTESAMGVSNAQKIAEGAGIANISNDAGFANLLSNDTEGSAQTKLKAFETTSNIAQIDETLEKKKEEIESIEKMIEVQRENATAALQLGDAELAQSESANLATLNTRLQTESLNANILQKERDILTTQLAIDQNKQEILTKTEQMAVAKASGDTRKANALATELETLAIRQNSLSTQLDIANNEKSILVKTAQKVETEEYIALLDAEIIAQRAKGNTQEVSNLQDEKNIALTKLKTLNEEISTATTVKDTLVRKAAIIAKQDELRTTWLQIKAILGLNGTKGVSMTLDKAKLLLDKEYLKLSLAKLAANIKEVTQLGLLTVAQGAAAAAATALNVAMMALPWVAVAAGIAAVTYGIIKLVAAKVEATEQEKMYNDAMEASSESVKESQKKIGEQVAKLQMLRTMHGTAAEKTDMFRKTLDEMTAAFREQGIEIDENDDKIEQLNEHYDEYMHNLRKEMSERARAAAIQKMYEDMQNEITKAYETFRDNVEDIPNSKNVILNLQIEGLTESEWEDILNTGESAWLAAKPKAEAYIKSMGYSGDDYDRMLAEYHEAIFKEEQVRKDQMRANMSFEDATDAVERSTRAIGENTSNLKEHEYQVNRLARQSYEQILGRTRESITKAKNLNQIPLIFEFKLDEEQQVNLPKWLDEQVSKMQMDALDEEGKVIKNAKGKVQKINIFEDGLFVDERAKDTALENYKKQIATWQEALESAIKNGGHVFVKSANRSFETKEILPKIQMYANFLLKLEDIQIKASDSVDVSTLSLDELISNYGEVNKAAKEYTQSQQKATESTEGATQAHKDAGEAAKESADSHTEAGEKAQEAGEKTQEAADKSKDAIDKTGKSAKQMGDEVSKGGEKSQKALGDVKGKADKVKGTIDEIKKPFSIKIIPTWLDNAIERLQVALGLKNELEGKDGKGAGKGANNGNTPYSWGNNRAQIPNLWMPDTTTPAWQTKNTPKKEEKPKDAPKAKKQETKKEEKPTTKKEEAKPTTKPQTKDKKEETKPKQTPKAQEKQQEKKTDKPVTPKKPEPIKVELPKLPKPDKKEFTPKAVAQPKVDKKTTADKKSADKKKDEKQKVNVTVTPKVTVKTSDADKKGTQKPKTADTKKTDTKQEKKQDNKTTAKAQKSETKKQTKQAKQETKKPEVKKPEQKKETKASSLDNTPNFIQATPAAQKVLAKHEEENKKAIAQAKKAGEESVKTLSDTEKGILEKAKIYSTLDAKERKKVDDFIKTVDNASFKDELTRAVKAEKKKINGTDGSKGGKTNPAENARKEKEKNEKTIKDAKEAEKKLFKEMQQQTDTARMNAMTVGMEKYLKKENLEEKKQLEQITTNGKERLKKYKELQKKIYEAQHPVKKGEVGTTWKDDMMDKEKLAKFEQANNMLMLQEMLAYEEKTYEDSTKSYLTAQQKKRQETEKVMADIRQMESEKAEAETIVVNLKKGDTSSFSEEMQKLYDKLDKKGKDAFIKQMIEQKKTQIAETAECINNANQMMVERGREAFRQLEIAYGTYEQKITAIHEEYEKKRREATTSEQYAAASLEEEEAMRQKAFEEFKKSINWEDVFENLAYKTTEALKAIREQLRRYSKDNLTLQPSDRKALSEQIAKIDEELQNRKVFDFGSETARKEKQYKDNNANNANIARDAYNRAVEESTIMRDKVLNALRDIRIEGFDKFKMDLKKFGNEITDLNFSQFLQAVNEYQGKLSDYAVKLPDSAEAINAFASELRILVGDMETAEGHIERASSDWYASIQSKATTIGYKPSDKAETLFKKMYEARDMRGQLRDALSAEVKRLGIEGLSKEYLGNNNQTEYIDKILALTPQTGYEDSYAALKDTALQLRNTTAQMQVYNSQLIALRGGVAMFERSYNESVKRNTKALQTNEGESYLVKAALETARKKLTQDFDILKDFGGEITVANQNEVIEAIGKQVQAYKEANKELLAKPENAELLYTVNLVADRTDALRKSAEDVVRAQRELTEATMAYELSKSPKQFFDKVIKQREEVLNNAEKNLADTRTQLANVLSGKPKDAKDIPVSVNINTEQKVGGFDKVTTLLQRYKDITKQGAESNRDVSSDQRDIVADINYAIRKANISVDSKQIAEALKTLSGGKDIGDIVSALKTIDAENTNKTDISEADTQIRRYLDLTDKANTGGKVDLSQQGEILESIEKALSKFSITVDTDTLSFYLRTIAKGTDTTEILTQLKSIGAKTGTDDNRDFTKAAELAVKYLDAMRDKSTDSDTIIRLFSDLTKELGNTGFTLDTEELKTYLVSLFKNGSTDTNDIAKQLKVLDTLKDYSLTKESMDSVISNLQRLVKVNDTKKKAKDKKEEVIVEVSEYNKVKSDPDTQTVLDVVKALRDNARKSLEDLFKTMPKDSEKLKGNIFEKGITDDNQSDVIGAVKEYISKARDNKTLSDETTKWMSDIEATLETISRQSKHIEDISKIGDAVGKLATKESEYASLMSQQKTAQGNVEVILTEGKDKGVPTFDLSKFGGNISNENQGEVADALKDYISRLRTDSKDFLNSKRGKDTKQWVDRLEAYTNALVKVTKQADTKKGEVDKAKEDVGLTGLASEYFSSMQKAYQSQVDNANKEIDALVKSLTQEFGKLNIKIDARQLADYVQAIGKGASNEELARLIGGDSTDNAGLYDNIIAKIGELATAQYNKNEAEQQKKNTLFSKEQYFNKGDEYDKAVTDKREVLAEKTNQRDATFEELLRVLSNSSLSNDTRVTDTSDMKAWQSVMNEYADRFLQDIKADETAQESGEEPVLLPETKDFYSKVITLLKEFIKKDKDVDDAEEDVNKAEKDKKENDEKKKKEDKGDDGSDGKKKSFNEILDSVERWAGKQKEVMEKVSSYASGASDIVNAAGIENTQLGQSISGLADGMNATAGAFAAFASGDYLGAAAKGLEAVGSYGKAAIGLIAGEGNVADMEEEIERLAKSNDNLSKAISTLSEQISDSDNTSKQSIDAYSQSVEAQKELLENQRKQIKAKASEYTNTGHGFLGLGGSSSFSYNANQAYGYGNALWKKFNDILVKNNKTKNDQGVTVNVNSLSDFYNLSPEQMKLIQAYAPDEWYKLFDVGGEANPSELIEEYIQQAGKLDDLTDALDQKLTGYTWDSFYEGYKNVLANMQSDTSDFADNINQLISNAVINALSEDMQSELNDLYSYIQEAAKSDGRIDLEEAEYIREENARISAELLARRKEAEDTGLLSDVSSNEASSTTNSAMSITEDTANQLVGRVTAMQMAVESMRVQDLNDSSIYQAAFQSLNTIMSTSLASLGEVLSGNGGTLSGIQDILSRNNIQLQNIADNTSALLKPLMLMQGDISEMKRNVRYL